MLLLASGRVLSENIHACIRSFRTLSEHLVCVRDHNQVLGVQCWIMAMLSDISSSLQHVFIGVYHMPGIVLGLWPTAGNQSRCHPCPHRTYHLVRKTTLTMWFSTYVKWLAGSYMISWLDMAGGLVGLLREGWALSWRKNREESRNISRRESNLLNAKDQCRWSTMNEGESMWYRWGCRDSQESNHPFKDLGFVLRTMGDH